MNYRIPIAAVCLSLVPSAFAASPLADSPSAFLRAHADSPVQWMTWDDDTFARAKADNKPVFLAVGSFTSELSRAMREQTFARAEIAALLNDNFVCVLVDREQQPDVAALFQAYVRAAKQLRGWPLNIWLTPELKPFEGATYLPPSEEWGKEGFPTVADRVISSWTTDSDTARRRADSDADAVRAVEPKTLAPVVDADAIHKLLAASTEEWMVRFDNEHGGFGDPPKYPEPELLRFLLKSNDASRDAALTTLRKIEASALHDPVDGGFFRYASDAAWERPNFQKTLSDQARLALAFLDAAQITGDAGIADGARRALTYALGFGDPEHGFAAAEDGSPEELLPSYLWTFDEIREALGADDAAAFCRAFGVTAEGNLEADAYLGVETAGKNLLHRITEPGDAEAEAQLDRARAKLLEKRHQRPALLRDDHATSGTCGLLLTALARAGKELPDARFATAARQVATFIREKLSLPDGGLRRLGAQPFAAAPRDRALVIDGLMTYADLTGDTSARELAQTLQAKLNAAFWDEKSGRYFASPAPTPQSHFARVHVPAPDSGDLPGAETAALWAFTSHEFADRALPAALASAIAASMRESFDPARGDQLLALQRFAQANK